MTNLIKAVLSVMGEVEGIDKSMTVGTGKSAYKAVSDESVKKAIGASMRKHGLIILPTKIEPKTITERWEEKTEYGLKTKQQVFTEVKTSYRLLHESGEFIDLEGYGHGVDPQDKSAGKATTYALKYLLLYTFLVPTGKLDDADKEHSEEKPVKKILPALTSTHKNFDSVKKKIQSGETTIEKVREYFLIDEETAALLQ